MVLVETTGAINRRTVGSIAYLSRRARGKWARDSTKYGSSRTSARTFFAHHAQQLSVAAAIGDVKGIHRAVQVRKQQRCCGGGATVPAA